MSQIEFIPLESATQSIHDPTFSDNAKPLGFQQSGMAAFPSKPSLKLKGRNNNLSHATDYKANMMKMRNEFIFNNGTNVNEGSTVGLLVGKKASLNTINDL